MIKSKITHLLKQVPILKKIINNSSSKHQVGNRRQFLLDTLPQNSIGAEIGVHKGNFSAQILKIVNPKELYLIDPWKYEASDTYQEALYGGKVQNGQEEMEERYETVCQRFEDQVHSGRVKFHRGFSSDVLVQFPDEFFDWVYIDGNHLYEYVKQDLELSFAKVKLGGYITGDDYGEGNWWKGGVRKAVDEFIKVYTVQVIEIKNGQFILRK